MHLRHSPQWQPPSLQQAPLLPSWISPAACTQDFALPPSIGKGKNFSHEILMYICRFLICDWSNFTTLLTRPQWELCNLQSANWKDFQNTESTDLWPRHNTNSQNNWADDTISQMIWNSCWRCQCLVKAREYWPSGIPVTVPVGWCLMRAG